MSLITVIGSISNDFVVVTQNRPNIGETIEGNSFSIEFGGKGANQAVAVARLGVFTKMVGAVGADHLGQELINNLVKNKVDVSNVYPKEKISSGSAVITVSENDNSIIYVPGANKLVDKNLIDNAKKTILDSDLVIVQNEIPLETVEYIIDICFENNVSILLNPAPAREMSKELIEKVTFITPNESEFEQIFGKEPRDKILRNYPNKLIITLGSKGVVFFDGEEIKEIPAFSVDSIVDTTGAGDTFNGGFAVGISKGLSINDSIRLGNLTASLSIQKFGAQGGMPTVDDIKRCEDYEKTWNLE